MRYLQEQLKKRVYILSGDSSETVRNVGRYLNIPERALKGECDAQSKKDLLRTLEGAVRSASSIH